MSDSRSEIRRLAVKYGITELAANRISMPELLKIVAAEMFLIYEQRLSGDAQSMSFRDDAAFIRSCLITLNNTGVID